MFEPKKLESGLSQPGNAEEHDYEASERLLATLLNNELVCGNRDIAESILQKAKPMSFAKGDKIIMQGGTDDCVYFMISGSVDVRINGRHIDYRNAPYTVGEMAAKRAGQSRTADVVVVSQSLSALAISGGDFRMLMSDFESFNANLNNAIDDLSRKKISQLGEKTENKGWSWNMISASVGVACLIGTALVTWLANFPITQLALTSMSVSVLGFVAMIFVNPELRYRNMYTAAGAALIALIVYGSISYAVTINGENVALPLIDFSVKTEQKIGILAVGALALLALSYISGALDLKLTHSRDSDRT